MAGGWTRHANMLEIKVKRFFGVNTKTLIVNTSTLNYNNFDILPGDIIEVGKK